MSFAATKEQVLDRSKTVTRRLGWATLKEGDVIQPVERCMGFKKGDRQVLLGPPVRVLSVRPEPVAHILTADVKAEGFPGVSADEFVEFFCRLNRCDPSTIVNRIEFQYLLITEPAPSAVEYLTAYYAELHADLEQITSGVEYDRGLSWRAVFRKGDGTVDSSYPMTHDALYRFAVQKGWRPYAVS